MNSYKVGVCNDLNTFQKKQKTLFIRFHHFQNNDLHTLIKLKTHVLRVK